MGIAGSPDIFQEKISDLMATLEFVRTYLDDLLIIKKGSLEDHLEKLSMVLTRLQEAGLRYVQWSLPNKRKGQALD